MKDQAVKKFALIRLRNFYLELKVNKPFIHYEVTLFVKLTNLVYDKLR